MEKISAFNTEEYILERANKASENKFKKALSQVWDWNPDFFDKI